LQQLLTCRNNYYNNKHSNVNSYILVSRLDQKKTVLYSEPSLVLYYEV